MGRGRPTKGKTTDIKKTLLEYFEDNKSAAYTARKTGHDIKTVYSYFKAFSEELNERIDNDFVCRQKRAKEMVIAKLEEDIEELTQQLDDIKKKCEDDPENSAWESLRLAIVSKRADVLQQKADIEMTPTIDVSLEELTKNENEPGGPETPKPKR